MNHKLIVEPETISSNYPEKPFLVRHNLASHPLFQISRLLEAESKLPRKKVDYYTGKVGVNEDKTKTAPTGLTAEETIRRIKECESWLVLKNVNWIPEYKALLDELFSDYIPIANKITPGIRQLESWIFITSPQSISPYHLDPEHNFLLQVHGTKIVHIFDANDPSLLSAQELENYYAAGGTIAKLEYKEEYQKKAWTFVLNPGEGVYIPYTAPHWVKVEDEYSISFSITHYSHLVDRKGRLYRLNSMIRKMGMNPAPMGQSAFRDAAKDALISTFLKTKKLISKGEAGGRAY
jgi:ribosomal protein L16 Arg81 hydroxylase